MTAWNSPAQETPEIDYARHEAEARRLRAIAVKDAGRAVLAALRNALRHREPARSLKGANA